MSKKTIAEQTKITQTNTFSGGLSLDTPISSTNSNVLTDCINGALITYNGDELLLQNSRGNIRVENSALPMGHIPISMESHAGILYIVSYNPDTNETEIGTYPSPKYINNFNKSENFINYNIDDVSVYFPEELVSDIKYFWTKKGITVSSTDEYIYDPPITILPFITHNQYAIDSEGRRELIHLISRDSALSDKDNTYAFPNTYKAYIASQQTPYYVNKLDCRIDTTNTSIPELTILLDNYISDSELTKALDSNKFKLINYVNYYFETESKKKYHVKYLWNCLRNNGSDSGNYTYGIDTITPPNDRSIDKYFKSWNKWTPSYKYIKGKDYIYTTGKITFSKYIDHADDFDSENFAPRLDFFKDGVTADKKVISFDKTTKTLLIDGEECINFVIEYVPCFEASIDNNTCILLFKDLYNKSILPARSVIADKELFSEFKYKLEGENYFISARLNSDVAYGDLKFNINSNSEAVCTWTFQRLLPNGELEYAGIQAKKTGYKINENTNKTPILFETNSQNKGDGKYHFTWEGAKVKQVGVPISIFDRGIDDCVLPKIFTQVSLNTLKEPEQCLEGDGIIVKESENKYKIVFSSSNEERVIPDNNVVIFDQTESPEILFTTNVPKDWLQKDNIYVATVKWQIADSNRPVKYSEETDNSTDNSTKFIASIPIKNKGEIEKIQESIQEYSNMNPIVVNGVSEMTASFIMCMTDSMINITDESIRRYDKLMLEEWWTLPNDVNISYYVENEKNIFEQNNSAYLTNRAPLEFQTESLSYDVNKFVAHYNHILKNDSIKNNISNIILGFNSSNRIRSLSWGSILQNELPGYSSKISHTIKSKVTSQSGSNPTDLNSVYHPNNISYKIVDGTLSYTWSDGHNYNIDSIDINKNLYLIDNNKSVDDLLTITSENRIYLDYDAGQSLGDILNKSSSIDEASSKMIFHNCERRYMIEYLNVLNWPYNQKYIPWLLDDVEKEISFKSKRIYSIDDSNRIGIHNNLASSEKVFIGYDKSDTSEDREYHLLLRSGSDQSVMKCEPYKNGKCKAGFNWTTFWHALFIVVVDVIVSTVIATIITGGAGSILVGMGLSIIIGGGLGFTYWKNAFQGLQTDISKTGDRALIYGTSKHGSADSISLQLMDVNSGNNMMPSFKKGKLCCENYVGYGDKNETKKWIKRIWSRAWVVHKTGLGDVQSQYFNVELDGRIFHGYSLIGYSVDDYDWERFEDVMGAFAKHAYALTPCNVGKTTENDQVYEFYFKNEPTEYTKTIESIDGLSGNMSLYPKQCNVRGNLENLNIQSWNNLISSQSVQHKSIDNKVVLSSNLNTIDEKYKFFLWKLGSTINDSFINKDQIFNKDFMNVNDTNKEPLMSLNIYMDYNDPLFLNEEMTESKTFVHEGSFEEFKLDYVRDIIYKEVEYDDSDNFPTDYFKYTQPCNTNKVHWNIKMEWPFKKLNNNIDDLNKYVSVYLLNKYGK